MKSLLRKSKTEHQHAELVALDFAQSGIKVVRLRRNRDQLQILGADILAPIPIREDDPPDKACRIGLPSHLLTKYAALAINSPRTRIRLLAAPSSTDKANEETAIREQMGIDERDRLRTAAVPTQGAPSPDRRLGVAIPESEIQLVLGLTASGPPAPCSLQASGMATFAAFAAGPGGAQGDDAAFLVEAGVRFTFVYCIHKGSLVLLRRHEQGAEALISHLRGTLNIDRSMASTILCDGAVDIGSTIQQVMRPLFKQLTITRDFVERQEKCTVGKLYLSGGLSRSRQWTASIGNALGLDPLIWNPFEGLPMAAGAYPDRLAGDEPRFTAALGAGMGVLMNDDVRD